MKKAIKASKLVLRFALLSIAVSSCAPVGKKPVERLDRRSVVTVSSLESDAVSTPTPDGDAQKAQGNQDFGGDKSGGMFKLVEVDVSEVGSYVISPTDTAIFSSTPEGLVIGDETISLFDGQTKKAIGYWPDFFGVADELMLKIPVVTRDLQPAAWYFYDSTPAKMLSASLPAYVYNKSENARPKVSGTTWRPPGSGAGDILFASANALWSRKDASVHYLKRDGSSWIYGTATVGDDLSSGTSRTFEENALHAISPKGAIISFLAQDGQILRRTISLPPGIELQRAMYVPLAEQDIVLTPSKTFVKPHGTAGWQIASFVYPDLTEPVGRVHIHGNRIYLFRDNRITVATAKATETSIFSGLGVVSEAVIAIGKEGCESCHSHRSTESRYVGANFDYRNYAHWKQLVTEKGEAEAIRHVISDMCVRLEASPCKADKGNQEVLIKFIGGVLKPISLTFANDVKPIADKFCVPCHGGPASLGSEKGWKDRVMTPSNLQKVINRLSPALKTGPDTMPLSTSSLAKAITDDQRNLIIQWLKQTP